MKIVVLSMVNGMDVVGELKGDPQDSGLVPLYHPCLIQIRPPACSLTPILRGSPLLDGAFSLVNMRAVMWINEPSDKIRQAYQINRAGLSAVPPKIAVGVNE